MASRTGPHLRRGGQKPNRQHGPHQPDSCPCPTHHMPHDDIATRILLEHKGMGGATLHPRVERPTRPFPVFPESNSPRTPPTGMPRPSRRPPKDTPSSYALATIPRFTLPHKPIHLPSCTTNRHFAIKTTDFARHNFLNLKYLEVLQEYELFLTSKCIYCERLRCACAFKMCKFCVVTHVSFFDGFHFLVSAVGV